MMLQSSLPTAVADSRRPPATAPRRASRHPPSGSSCRFSPSEFEIPHFLNVRDFNLSRERLGNFSLIRPTISTTADPAKVLRTVQFSSHYFSLIIRQYGKETFLDKKLIHKSIINSI